MMASRTVPDIVPRAPWRVSSVHHMPGFMLSVRFNDGVEGTVSLYRLIHSPNAGVFAVLKDEELFSKVALHYGAVSWPGDLDLAPDAMHEAICRGGEYVL